MLQVAPELVECCQLKPVAMLPTVKTPLLVMPSALELPVSVKLIVNAGWSMVKKALTGVAALPAASVVLAVTVTRPAARLCISVLLNVTVQVPLRETVVGVLWESRTTTTTVRPSAAPPAVPLMVRGLAFSLSLTMPSPAIVPIARVGATVSRLKLNGSEVPLLPAASVWEAVIALLLPWPMEVMLVPVRA